MRDFLSEFGILLGVLSIVIVIGAVVVTVASTRQDKARAYCEAKGGVYFAPSAGSICLRSTAVIPFN